MSHFDSPTTIDAVPVTDRFAARRRRLAAARGRILAVAVVLTLALWGAVVLSLVSERAESHSREARSAFVAPASATASSAAPARASGGS